MYQIKFYIPVLLIIGLLINACATTQSISDEVRTQTFNTDYDQTFQTVVQILSDDGYIIDNADSDTGIINTDYSNASTLEAFFTGDRRTKINAMLNDTNKGTRVRLTVSVQKKAALTGWQSATMTKGQAEDYYEELFNKIGNQLATSN